MVWFCCWTVGHVKKYELVLANFVYFVLDLPMQITVHKLAYFDIYKTINMTWFCHAINMLVVLFILKAMFMLMCIWLHCIVIFAWLWFVMLLKICQLVLSKCAFFRLVFGWFLVGHAPGCWPIGLPGVGSKYFLKKNLQKISEKREKKFNIHWCCTVALL